MLDFVMPRRLTVAADVLAWGVVHAGTGYVAHRIDVRHLDCDGWLLRPKAFEDGGRWYRRRWCINRWKDRLPEAGDLFAGGVSKSHLPTSADGGLDLFVRETRRAELTHWWAMMCGPIFALWNPPLVTALLVSYGIAVNLPFIVIQRYNRFRCQTIIAHRAATPEAVGAAARASNWASRT